MKVFDCSLPDVKVIEPDVFSDDRGYFLETWSASRYREAGIDERFVQDNVSRSRKGVIRGLHLQHPMGQGKLVWVAVGEVFDVAVDVRVGSPTFGRWTGERLSEDNHRQLYIPPGFAHGFCVMSANAVFCYKCSAPYDASAELGIAFNDPKIGIEWPTVDPLVSLKDSRLPRLADIAEHKLPGFSRDPQP